MNEPTTQVATSYELSAKIGRVLERRVQVAQERFNKRVQTAYKDGQAAYKEQIAALVSHPMSPWDLWTSPWDAWMSWQQYAIDFVQRSILFWDTLRERGNIYLEHERAGKPPVLSFDYEMVLDGRRFERPVNYALLRIIAPKGIQVDPSRRPYVIIDPRAGHGPGIGGFKDDSEVGVALREGHPVYFVTFFPETEPGQTLLDVCEAEAQFLHTVRELHPRSPKPAIVGNCQGGWAAMMLAATHPEETGPIVINGAPMSYWGGAWSEGEGNNPMRYAGGLLGGTWLASLASDLGNGVFDGANLVQNFENLNPANTLWDKYYQLFANVDTEPPRFLQFERWWGGYYLLNRAEIEWIVQNLFVGNKLWTGAVRAKGGQVLDLREIKSPIILFASLGDNITPPQQAFNWVADVYGSTEEIKARGQTIVGLVHEKAGHLGIFVSGKVAKKEHAEIVSIMKSIEALPAGLYAMHILESKGADGKVTYDVEFTERRLEDVMERLNRFERRDEKPFEAAAAMADFNEMAYKLFAQPVVQNLCNEASAELGRAFHPLRVQHWAISDWNPWLWWLGPAAEAVRAHRQPTSPDAPLRRVERMLSEIVSASLDLFRDMRDAMSEALFYQIYGNLFELYMADRYEAEQRGAPQAREGRELSFVRAALDSIAQGGYPEALARVAALLAHRGRSIPLSWLELRAELLSDYRDLLPDLPRDQARRIRGEQEIIVQYEPQRAIATLPQLLKDPVDRERLLTLLDRLRADKRLDLGELTPDDRAMLDRIRRILTADQDAAPRLKQEVMTP